MKATRANIASLGTTGLLVGAAFVLLLVGSAVVAFDGWPGPEDDDGIGDVVVDGGGASRLTPAEALFGRAARPAPEREPGDTRAATAGSGEAPEERAPAGGGEDGAAGPGRSPAAGAPPASGVPAPRERRPAPAGPGDDGGGMAEQTVGPVDQTVGQIHPQAGDVVIETGRAIDELVEELAPPGLP